MQIVDCKSDFGYLSARRPIRWGRGIRAQRLRQGRGAEESEIRRIPAERTNWVARFISCLTKRRFWEESVKDAVWLITISSSGFGVVMATVALNISHRVALMARDLAN
jgi:hypothetical protein